MRPLGRDLLFIAPENTDGPLVLKMEPLADVLDRLAPPDIADLSFDCAVVFDSGSRNGKITVPPMDALMTFYKGVVGGVLLGVGASEVMWLHTDEYSFFYFQEEGDEDPLPEDEAMSYETILNQLYQGQTDDKPTWTRRLSLQQSDGEYTLVTDIRVQNYDYALTGPDDRDYGVMIVMIECEGGPPSDVFIYPVAKKDT